MKVIYAGSFDPVTHGHLDIIFRARKIFGEVIVAVLNNKNKAGLFSTEERLHLLREVLKDEKGIEVDSFEGLLVDYAQEKGISTVVRGLRSNTDYESEYMLAMANKNYGTGLETVFLLSDQNQLFVSSSLAKEVAMFDGDTSLFVPAVVGEAMKKKMRGR
ncbi:Phosphopantetheine adenylyltransferase [Aedoeadaptatus ivorii]|uniref:Phosphopantetheine adenylyltransferase n=1 Tax=Aedoeadaptatus ivorii TaxID=54006 RepID=A0A3S4ZQK9_9FIRM|nr:pantetheine-phosphate adenylyltransferase [Peptoniphilus ivorii]MDQ0507794.1 pantetheine-phosphate adenylyltransferase [Peptoniphilus ivorii]VEJ35611.1 Phosphopantetheine adenylyltransferase [Peptoniphilus ivorii]